MSFDVEYDADGDVARFLESPGHNAHLLYVPEPEAPPPVHGDPIVPRAEALLAINPAPVVGIQAPDVHVDQHQAPEAIGFQEPATDAEPHQAPPAIGFPGPAAAVDVEQHQAAPEVGLQGLNTGIEYNPTAAFGFPHAPAYGFPPLVLDVGQFQPSGLLDQMVGAGDHQPDPAFGFQAPILGVDHHQAPGFGFQEQIANGVVQQWPQAYGFQADPAVDAGHVDMARSFGLQQASGTDFQQHLQASMFGFQCPFSVDALQHLQASFFGGFHNAPDMEAPASAFAFHSSTSGFDNQQASSSSFNMVTGMGSQQGQHYNEHDPATDVQHHQGPATNVLHPQQAPAVEQANAEHNPAPAQEADPDYSSWLMQMFDEGRHDVPPTASARQEGGLQAVVAAQEHQARNAAVDGGAKDNELNEAPSQVLPSIYIPFVRGELDCSRCNTVREVVNEDERYKALMIIHSVDEGTLEHAIMECMSADANGDFKTFDLHYVELRERTQEWRQKFIDYSVKVLRKIKKGQVHDRCSASYIAAVGFTSKAPPKPSAPVANSKGKQRKASKQHSTDAISRIKPVDFIGFTPDTLETSHVKPYDPESGESIVSYPSELERKLQSQQARRSTFTMQDALAKFEEVNKEIAKEPDFSSSMAFKQLCRLDNSYRKYSRRIRDINKKFMKLEEKAQTVGRTALFKIMLDLETYLQEKAELFDIIDMGLHEFENDDDDEAGPSGSSTSLIIID